MPPTPTVQTVQQDSIITVTISGAKDGTGVLLDNTNASWSVAVADFASGASILVETLMTYSGTAGKWTYNIPAADWGSPYDDRLVTCREYDQNGINLSTLRLTLPVIGRIAAAATT